MPVAPSDNRRNTIIGIGGLVFGVMLILIVLFANSTGDGGSDGAAQAPGARRSEFDAGPAKARAAAIERDRYPLLFQDPAVFTRPIWVQHLGSDPLRGWLAFDAAVEGCALAWEPDAQEFRDCAGRAYPPDGEGLRAYPVRVTRDEHVVVDLNPQPGPAG
ncbi:MAG: hypothetical protein ACT4PW_07390 [Acidimicrobiia bacterium]